VRVGGDVEQLVVRHVPEVPVGEPQTRCMRSSPPSRTANTRIRSQPQAATQPEVVHRYLAVRQIFNERVACHHCTMRSGT
jgi:hypothetical protein